MRDLKPRVLISGASVAGPALAYWLDRYGFAVTIVEKADGIRIGGQPVDFKGPIHRAVLRKMGILDAAKQAHVTNEDGIMVNAMGRKIGTVPGQFAGGEINVPRGDLARILYKLTAEKCEYIFGDFITSIADNPGGVDVTFSRTDRRTFDIVVGADGIHSNVRRLAFGPEADYVRYLGYYYALARIKTGDGDLMYNEPGRMAALSGSKALAFFVFATDLLPAARDDVGIQKKQLIDAYHGSHWRVPEIMKQIPDAEEFYMDSISRVTADHYARGHVVLVGDAAYGNALGGFGTGLAMVGAYVLAGELRRSPDDATIAFGRYEAKFRDYASISQKLNAGRLLAPSTGFGIRMRNTLFSALSVFGPLMKLVDRPATNLKLEDYEG